MPLRCGCEVCVDQLVELRVAGLQRVLDHDNERGFDELQPSHRYGNGSRPELLSWDMEGQSIQNVAFFRETVEGFILKAIGLPDAMKFCSGL